MAEVPKVEVVGPDPAVTSISNDETVNAVKEEATPAPAAETTGQTDATNQADAAHDEKKEPSEEADTKPVQPSSSKKRSAPEDQPISAHQRKRYSENVKSDLTSQPESSDPDEIRKQVEFYFSDSNLPMDKFLFDQVGGSANKPVPIKLIHSFKRMRHFQPYSAIVAALRDSTILEVVENEEVRRRIPLEEGVGKNPMDNIRYVEDRTLPRSIYAKGFGEETPSTQFDIEAFFAPYGPTNAIRLRRSYPERVFKGSVFVEFDSEETQKAFLELDPKPKYNGQELLIMSKKAYVEMKQEDIRTGKIKPNDRPMYHSRDDRRGGRGRGRGDRDRKGSYRERRRSRDKDDERDDRDWKGRRDDFQRNGYKDRNSRGRGRGRDRDRGGRERRRDVDDVKDKEERDEEGRVKEEEKDAQETKVEPQVDARGVPVVAFSEPTANGQVATKSEDAAMSEAATESKKRSLEADAATEDAGDAKKTKADETVAEV